MRVALGASPSRVVGAVFAQPVRQLGLGLVTGTLLVAFLIGMTEGSGPSARQFLFLGGYTVLMTAVCMVACVVPTRRALSVQPTEALRDY